MFDEAKLVRELRSLPILHATAFAASCCERTIPNYFAFYEMEKWGNPTLLRQALDIVWAHLSGATRPVHEIQNLLQSFKLLIPDTEDFSSLFTSQAGDAVASIAYTMESLINEDINLLAVVGRLSFDSVYAYLWTVNDPDTEPHIVEASFEEQIIRLPLIVLEVEKQHQDLALLMSLEKLTIETLEFLQRSSAKLGIRPFERGLVRVDKTQ
jgi:uncharacterized protein YjaG (DUF416 family)